MKEQYFISKFKISLGAWLKCEVHMLHRGQRAKHCMIVLSRDSTRPVNRNIFPLSFRDSSESVQVVPNIQCMSAEALMSWKF